MSRIYPPNWCTFENEKECTDCDFIECDEKILKLLKSVEYPTIDFAERPKTISATTVGIYFGYCERLAHFFLKYPQINDLSIVKSNFYCTKDSLPTKADIPRILLDLLTHGIDKAPTDDVHKLKMMLGMKGLKTNRAILAIGNDEKEIVIPQNEIDEFYKKAITWKDDVVNKNPVSFRMTTDLNKCKYCFLHNCDQELE
jgi:hypothetical protein